MSKALLDTSGELLLQPFNNGFKLISPDDSSCNSQLSIDEVFRSPLNLYFLDTNSTIQNINETTVNTCNYRSVKHSIGKTRHIAADKETVEKITLEDLLVVQSAKQHVFEEHFVRLDQISFPAIAFKYPWYNSENKVIGIFGCSIVLDGNHSSMISSLALMMKLGLLGVPNGSNQNPCPLPGVQFNNTYLSKQESICLRLVVQGKTAKMIAKILKISPRTVEHYIENIKFKLNVQSKSELIEKALEGLPMFQDSKN